MERKFIWEQGLLSAEVYVRDTFIKVSCRLKKNNQSKSLMPRPNSIDKNTAIFTMEAEIHYNPDYIRFSWMDGNGQGSDYQRKGVGHFLTNTFIQFARRELNLAPDIEINGDMAYPHDSGDTELLKKNELDRMYFWESLGLKTEPPNQLTGKLSELKLIQGVLLDRYQRLISVDDFTEHSN